MGFSDDYASSATPFSGDGDYFDSPDMVRTSAVTSERVVDTQSGFLVVVRAVDTRLSLSVKRRLGTPPVSSILLTPDESLKLSRILSTPGGDETSSNSSPSATLNSNPSSAASPSRLTNTISAGVDSWLENVNSLNLDSNALDSFSESDRPGDSMSRSGGRRARARQSAGPKFNISKKQIVIAASASVLVAATAFAINGIMHKASQPVAAPVAVDQLENARVDKFSREFVSDMLDFSPKTYRVSQVHAMANMVPELMDKYWQETHFPLSPAQLKGSPEGLTLMITRVAQVRVADTSREVDIFAELVSANSKISSPVHLKLTVGTSDDGQLRVLDQKDLSPHK